MALLDHVNREAFRQLLISRGTNVIFSDEEKLKPFTYLIDQIDGPNGEPLSYSQANHLLVSPREFVKFFHRRNACTCLKDLFYNLKDNTPKKTLCIGCNTITRAKDTFECECKQRIYCSRKCAKKDWTNHKNECKAFKG